MSVVTDSNKQMLFELLKSIGEENNLVVNDQQLSIFINKKCDYYHTNRYEFGFGNDLNEINKKIIGEGYNFVMSNQPKKRVEVAQKIDQMSRREMFDVGLANQEAQFKKMINPKKPKEIDFTDGGEDFPIQNLDQIMNQTLADRQRELESITQKYSSGDKEKAQKWLNREEDSTPKIKIEKTSDLKIDNTITSLTEFSAPERQTAERRVRFEVNEKTKSIGLNNLFSKLKQKKPISNDDIINKLDTIISNQDKILKLLEKENSFSLDAI